MLQAAATIQLPRFLEYCHRRYGDRFTVRMGPFGTFVYFADPADIRTIFHGDDAVFHAGEANAPFLGQVLGPSSVLCTDDAVHLRQRRRLSGPFHGDSIAKLAPLMAEIAAADVDRWPVGREFAVLPRMRKITLEVILRTVVGIKAEETSRLQDLRSSLAELVDLGLVKMAPFAFPSLARCWPWTRYREVQTRADALIRNEIDRARRAPDLETRNDVLALLVGNSDMTTTELRDQLVTLLLAGHETTATGLAWTLERLTRHPRALAEATRAAHEGDYNYLDATLTESLRVRPVVPDITRRLVADVTVGEGDNAIRVPAGTYVDPSVYLVMRSPKYYPDPLSFRPERFVGQRPDQTVWIPFGGGTRRCLGASFALTEMRVVLSEVLQRVELASTTRRGERTRVRHVTLAPHRGARVTVTRRVARGRQAVRDDGSSLASLSG
jgi:cytochrome P450 family 135